MRKGSLIYSSPQGKKFLLITLVKNKYYETTMNTTTTKTTALSSVRALCRAFLTLLTVLLLTHPISLWAQSPRLYSTAQGLVNTRISDLWFDTQNFLWVSTEMGLARFNGQNFTNYFANDDDPYALHTSGINCVYEDPSGRHWVGTTDGLYYFCRTENKFTPYALRPDSSLTISISEITAYPSRLHHLLISTHGYGLYVFDAERREVCAELSQRLSRELEKYNLTTHLVDHRGQLWALQRDRIAVIDLTGEPHRMTLHMTPDVEASVMHSASYALLEDADKGLVYLGGVSGLYVADEQTLTLRCVEGAEHLNIRSLGFDADGNLLIGTENQGLYRHDAASGQTLRQHYANCPCDLDRSKIHSIVLDRQHNLWLGLFQQGVMIVPARTDMFHYYPVSMAEGGSNLASISCFATIGTDHYLVGTDGGGLMEYDAGLHRLLTTDNSALRTNAIISLTTTPDGDAYVGTFNEGLYRWHAGVITCPRGLAALRRTSIMCQVFDTISSTLYIGTNGHGLYAYSPAADSLRRLAADVNEFITALCPDGQTTLWVATEGHTVRLDLTSNTWEIVAPDVHDKLRVVGIVPDSDCVWLAGNQGLWRYDRQTGQFSHVPDEARRRGEVTISMTRDDEGRLWMATNLGIVAYLPSTDEILHYGGDEIDLVGSFSERSVAHVESGRLVMGGDNGLILFTPSKVAGSVDPLPEVYFTQLWVNNALTDYAPASDCNVLDAALWHAKCLTLRPEENSFTIAFALQEYGNPSAIRYAYRLEGYDETWHELPFGTTKTVNYARLPWGTYHFQVRAFVHENQTAGASFKQLTVEVLRPWYATWWAYLLYLLLAAALIQLFIHYLHQRTHQKRLLERTRHQQQIKEAKLQLFTSISHEIKTPLTLIISPLRSLMDKKVDNATASVYELMYRNAMRILMLVGQQMDIRKIDHGKLHLKMKPLGVRAFLGEIMEYFNNAAMSHQIHYDLAMPVPLDDLTLWGDPDQLDKVFFNLLSNAFKFTPCQGNVRLTVSRVPAATLPAAAHDHVSRTVQNYLSVCVFNSGSSLRTEDMDHLFERFYQGQNEPECAGSGIGLNLAYELTLLHHGFIQARNAAEGEGVEFEVWLPLGSDHLTPDELAPTVNDLSEPNASSAVSDMVLTPKMVMKADSDETIPTSESSPIADDPGAAEARGPVTVLLVDDDADFLDYVRGELRDYRVLTAKSGTEAWGQLLVEAPDVVVTDVQMPGGDGYELCRRIKHNIDTENIPVIVLTAENTTDAAEQAMACQADRFLNKPLNVTLLRGAIEQSLTVRRGVLRRARRTDVGFSYDQVKMESADTKLMQHVMESIRRHLGDSDFNVEQLSHEVGISRVHLNRKMKELLGTSPSTLIRSVRLKQAAFLLVENNVTVSEIAYSVGFSSPSYSRATSPVISA
jgi:signal transduction histidine kinase/ligand-binding sensor domain-containing protein/DNA-binding response OmpR family regulator